MGIGDSQPEDLLLINPGPKPPVELSCTSSGVFSLVASLSTGHVALQHPDKIPRGQPLTPEETSDARHRTLLRCWANVLCLICDSDMC